VIGCEALRQTSAAASRPRAGKAIVAKNPNTFEKRRREIEKKQRAEEKRKRRKTRKDQPDKPDDTPQTAADYLGEAPE